MINMNVKINRNLLTPALKRIRTQLAALPQEIYEEFVKNTPIDKGNARRSTQLVNNKKIAAKYTYASRLENGWSKQAPKGMIKPTQEWAKKRIKEILRKK
jgi:hypothetical protein